MASCKIRPFSCLAGCLPAWLALLLISCLWLEAGDWLGSGWLVRTVLQQQLPLVTAEENASASEERRCSLCLGEGEGGGVRNIASFFSSGTGKGQGSIEYYVTTWVLDTLNNEH